jgi:ligand-binding SRPBCC domain-containing protein
VTVLENSIRINAPRDKVWSVLASLDALDQYDPGVKKSQVVSSRTAGLGAARQCDLVPGGWFKEKVTEWRPQEALAFELFECTLPVRRLKHSYTLTPDSGGTIVHQRMEYELKFGPLGKLMDAMMVRKKWNIGIKGFFAGLKRYVEAGASTITK